MSIPTSRMYGEELAFDATYFPSFAEWRLLQEERLNRALSGEQMEGDCERARQSAAFKIVVPVERRGWTTTVCVCEAHQTSIRSEKCACGVTWFCGVPTHDLGRLQCVEAAERKGLTPYQRRVHKAMLKDLVLKAGLEIAKYPKKEPITLVQRSGHEVSSDQGKRASGTVRGRHRMTPYTRPAGKPKPAPWAFVTTQDGSRYDAVRDLEAALQTCKLW